MASELRSADCWVSVIRFEELPEKGDVSDWLDAGHTVEELKELVLATDPLPPKPKNRGPCRIQCEKSDPPVYLWHFSRGVIRVANDDLYDWTAVGRAHTATLKSSPQWGAGMSRRQWEEEVDKLLAAMEEDPDAYIEVPEERTYQGRVRQLLVKMARRHRKGVNVDGGINVDEERFYFRFSELVTVNAESFNIQKGIDRERMTRVHLHIGLERLGGHVVKGRGLSWVSVKLLELAED